VRGVGTARVGASSKCHVPGGSSTTASTDKTAATPSADLHAQKPSHSMSKSSSKMAQPDMNAMQDARSQRHAAVRKCAQQADQGQRESCLDQVVAQFGSS